jgi:hypothetical protein
VNTDTDTRRELALRSIGLMAVGTLKDFEEVLHRAPPGELARADQVRPGVGPQPTSIGEPHRSSHQSKERANLVHE